MRLYLDHLGIACSLGTGTAQVVENLFLGRSPLTPNSDYSSGSSFLVGQVDHDLPAIPDSLGHYDCRNNRLLLLALAQIDEAVKSSIECYGRDRVGVVLGTSTSGIEEAEKAFKHKNNTQVLPESFHFLQQQLSGPSDFLAKHLCIAGPCITISTACSSSANALATARSLLLLDQCDAVIVGGADSLCRLTIQGFASLEAMSHSVANPFSKNRNGINIGEGAALMILSKTPSNIALAGVGCSSDAHHISAPHPQGEGAERAMRAALNQAQFSPDMVGYLNLHGTGTPLNDAAESFAVNRLFGSELSCSSSKPLTGHTLGAAGIIETALCWLSMQPHYNSTASLIPHLWDGVADPDIAPINLVGTNGTNTMIPRVCMSNSFAFGGNNTSVILSSSEA